MWKIISQSWIYTPTHDTEVRSITKIAIIKTALICRQAHSQFTYRNNVWMGVRCARCRIVRIRSIKFNSEKLSTHSTVQLAAASVTAAHMCSTHTSHNSMLSHPCFFRYICDFPFIPFGPHCCKFGYCFVGINCWLLFTLWYTTNSYFIGLLLQGAWCQLQELFLYFSVYYVLFLSGRFYRFCSSYNFCIYSRLACFPYHLHTHFTHTHTRTTRVHRVVTNSLAPISPQMYH